VPAVQDIAGNAESPAARARPVLIYDGECGFCVYWAKYWQRLTGGTVDYRPYQEAATDYPAIPLWAFRNAVQYVAPDGRRAQGAEASFLVLSHAPGKRLWLWLYRNLPGFAPISERAYGFIAAHRPAAYRASLVLWGRALEPSRYDLVAFLFLRLFALIYLAAFASFGVQAMGLIGSHGILPLAQLVDILSGRVGPERFFLMPMLFWANAGDLMIRTVCWAGAALSALLALNLLPNKTYILLYLLYLSLFYGGQAFMTYQWDTFLLEAGFIAILMSFWTVPGVWLVRWLLFRFMFMSGVVKLSSGDPNWRNLSALSYHFLTQPLPTPIAWYAARLPQGVLAFCTGATLAVELVLPVFIFCPRRLRYVAAFGILLLETLISLTGNYNWFNLQTMLLCLALFDDRALRRVLPNGLRKWLGARARSIAPGRLGRATVGALAALAIFSGLVQMDARFGGAPPKIALAADSLIEPFRIASGYGLFAVMTTTRDEIVIEGSNDGTNWREYEFRYKPGDVARAPRWNIPHQPRLDWQMWFAALDDPRRLPWLSHFVERLLQNEPAVTALLEKNPFPDDPPIYIRAQFYDYTYATADEKARGIWWDRRLIGTYFPMVHLDRE